MKRIALIALLMLFPLGPAMAAEKSFVFGLYPLGVMSNAGMEDFGAQNDFTGERETVGSSELPAMSLYLGGEVRSDRLRYALTGAFYRLNNSDLTVRGGGLDFSVNYVVTDKWEVGGHVGVIQFWPDWGGDHIDLNAHLGNSLGIQANYGGKPFAVSVRLSAFGVPEGFGAHPRGSGWSKTDSRMDFGGALLEVGFLFRP